MSNRTDGLLGVRGFHDNQQGITGLETAIVLISFLTMGAVFAFMAVSAGFISTERSTATVLGGLEEASGTMSLRGEVIADANTAKTAIDAIKFTVTPASTSSDSVDLSTSGTVITYLDDNQGINWKIPRASITMLTPPSAHGPQTG